jgi:NAD(P)H-dependent flavin oxidoreductase YrpB (nitropropane dioxygenase family)
MPLIIQGGMGVGVSGWQLARAVSTRGQLGVVAGTALATTFVRRVQLGDEGGHLRRAIDAFPAPEMATRIFDKYFRSAPRIGVPLKRHPLPTVRFPRNLLELTIVASFAEVFLAREQHDGLVGLNLLEKIQLPTLATLFGSMLAGVDYVLMGAGIPRAIPGILDRLARRAVAQLPVDVAGARAGEKFLTSFDPAAVVPDSNAALKRPKFLAIVSSAALATTLARKSSGCVDGFVIEGPSAGGHNAPPRGTLQLSAHGEPIYGPRDTPELDKIRNLELPFWLAGGYGRPGKLEAALALGAAGIQVGTAFAFCEESGIRADLKDRVIRDSRAGRIGVFTDPRASPTGFPLKVVQLEDTVSEPGVFAARRKICDLGYLRRAYRRPDGKLGYRCPGEPEEDFLNKGGAPEEIDGRKCVCNGLLATVGLAQVQKQGSEELPLVTAGYDVGRVAEFLPPGRDSYSAGDVIDRLLAGRVTSS